MTKAVLLFPFILLVVSENLFAKETSLKHSDKSNPNKKLLHQEKQKAVLSNKAHNPQNRNHLQRCQIICPFVLPSPANCNGGPNQPVVPTAKPFTSAPPTTASPTEKPTTESEESTEDDDTESDTDAPPSNSTSQSKNITSKFNKPLKRGFTQTFRIVTSNLASNKLKNRLGHGDRKNTYYRLSDREKHILLKQLKLGSRQGKKGYKFRQINPFQCQVLCHVIYEDEYPSIAQPITSYQEGDSDDDDDNDDGYQEGEDTPIEITIKPIVPQNTVIGGIRPFGNVDFMGMSDFGPSGDFPGDPPAIFEDKTVRKKTEKAKPRKKAVIAEKRI